MPSPQRIKIQLGDQNAYMYRSYQIRKSPFFSCCRSQRNQEDPPSHARRLLTDALDVNQTWAVLLLEDMQQDMAEKRKTSIHVYSRAQSRLLFKSRIGRVQSEADEAAVIDTYVVRDVLWRCLINAQPTDCAVQTIEGRKFLVQSVPVWDDTEKLAGALWTARRVLSAEDDLDVSGHRRAAMRYDVATGTFVLNETWIRQRHLLGTLFTGNNTRSALILDVAGRIESFSNPDVIKSLLLDNVSDLPCDVAKCFSPQVATHISEIMRSLQEKETRGAVITGLSMPLGDYMITTTKTMDELTHVLLGYMVVIQPTQALQQMTLAVEKRQARSLSS